MLTLENIEIAWVQLISNGFIYFLASGVGFDPSIKWDQWLLINRISGIDQLIKYSVRFKTNRNW